MNSDRLGTSQNESRAGTQLTTRSPDVDGLLTRAAASAIESNAVVIVGSNAAPCGDRRNWRPSR